MSVSLKSHTLNPGRPEDNAAVRLQLRSGRDRAQIKRWWNEGCNHKNYIDCSGVVLDGVGGCQYELVWPHSYDSRLDLEWVAHSGTISFKMFHRVDRMALLCMDGTVLTHWVFGKIPGVKPRAYHINDSCPDGCTPGAGGGGDSDHCWTIPELPTIDTDEKVAEKSTRLFDICVDINALSPL